MAPQALFSEALIGTCGLSKKGAEDVFLHAMNVLL